MTITKVIMLMMVTMMTTMTMREMFNQGTKTVTNLLTMPTVLSLPQFMTAVIIIFEKCFCHKCKSAFIFIHFT